jgi:hypothetical protein
MNRQLPIEGQKVQVKLKQGEWQDAVYQDENFVDLYGLPLGYEKVLEWRAVASADHINGASHVRRPAIRPSGRQAG